MKPSHETIEVITSFGAMAIGLIAFLAVGRLLLQEVHRGRLGRFRATVIQGVTAMVLGVVPLAVATVVTWLAALGGVALFSREGGNDGLLLGLGLGGLFLAMGTAALFAAIMIFQALTGSGSSEVSS